MNHEEIADSLGAYALDALDDDERAVVASHLQTCARCRAEVEDHRQVASFLAHGGGDAPEGVWERIEGALSEPPPALRLVPGPGDESRAGAPRRRRAISRVATAALAAAAVVVAVLGVQVRNQDRRIDELQTALQDPLVPAFQTALTTPGSDVIELVSADGRVTLRGAITPEGVGYLRATDLPDLPEGRTYQLWGAAGSQLVSLGVLGASPAIVTFAADRYDAFAITEEASPGVVVTEQSPVVAGSVA